MKLRALWHTPCYYKSKEMAKQALSSVRAGVIRLSLTPNM
jgi:hypothetical protein